MAEVDRHLVKRLVAAEKLLSGLGHDVELTPNGPDIHVGRCRFCNYLTLIERKKGGKKWKAWGTALTTECPRTFVRLKGPKP